MSVTDLRALYAQQLAERGFQTDPAQLAAVARLDDLRRRLIDSGAARASPVRRFFRGLRRRAALVA